MKTLSEIVCIGINRTPNAHTHYPVVLFPVPAVALNWVFSGSVYHLLELRFKVYSPGGQSWLDTALNMDKSSTSNISAVYIASLRKNNKVIATL